MIKCRRKENPVFCVADTSTQNGTIRNIFGGANRKLSEKDGLVVDLCHSCHNEPPNGVHFNKERMDALRRYGQTVYENNLIGDGKTRQEARTAFIKRYGKNYL